ncbi:T9SS type A sorting domain-containing protein [Aureisphaera galaxeae]|uniref:T9SS type A sorting domain-containing protein n=1 Tax=Aureisphaera galaxeae TaxID=1538023 RepID=UPI00234FEF57|nr:T9SS type A sorting domain-containing protein [Aureisphaera galaxeae]MDC8005149.1 T9SS type A sorting domain-containing protein [Aureisphaera galaxeae]
MKQIYVTIVLVLSFCVGVQAQNTVEVDAGASWIGFANVFDLPADGGGYVFGEVWGVPDIQTIIDVGAGTVTLHPNFNTYADNPTDPFWVNQTTGEGNKIFEGNTFVEDNGLVGSELTFNGYTESNTLDSEYTAMAFIKVFNGDFSVLKIETAELIAGQNFSITYTDVAPEDAVVQYGFYVSGVNANPADEAALGNIVVTAPVLSVNDINAVNVSVYPNPANKVWNISTTNQNIQSVAIYDVLGKLVAQQTVNDTAVAINNESLNAGVYFAQVKTDAGTQSVKLIRK